MAPWPGDVITLTGSGLDATATAALVSGDRRIELSPIDADGEHLQIALPANVPIGAWHLAVARGGMNAETFPVLDVWSPDTEPPCTKRYALATETNRTQRKIAFDRIFDDRESTRHVFLGDELKALVLTPSRTPFDTVCWALYLVDDHDKRWLIADDAAAPLRPKAEAIAEALGLPLSSGS